MRVYYTLVVWRFKSLIFLSVGFEGTCIHIYLAVYSRGIIGGFGLEKKIQAVCGLGRTNYGSLWNVQPSTVV